MQPFGPGTNCARCRTEDRDRANSWAWPAPPRPARWQEGSTFCRTGTFVVSSRFDFMPIQQATSDRSRKLGIVLSLTPTLAQLASDTDDACRTTHATQTKIGAVPCRW